MLSSFQGAQGGLQSFSPSFYRTTVLQARFFSPRCKWEAQAEWKGWPKPT